MGWLAPGRRIAAIALTALPAWLAAAPGAAQQAPFAGATISIYAGSGVGGIYDTIGRLVARHIDRHIEGSPRIVVQAMPGAGSIAAANFIYNAAPKDGTALGVVSPSVKVMEVFPGARYEAARYNWIGRVFSATNVTFTMAGAKVRTIEDARTSEATIGATAPSSPLSFFTRALNVAGGTRFKVTHGYIDANAVLLAVDRGEIEGATVSWNSVKSMRGQWLKEGRINLLVQYLPTPHPELRHVPTAMSLARTPADRDLLELFMNAAVVGMAVMAPPQTPPDRVEVLRNAFVRMLEDPAYKADVLKLDPIPDPLPGRQLQEAVDATARFPAELMQRAAKIMTAG